MRRLLTDEEVLRIERDYPASSGCPTCGGQGKYRLNDEEFDCDCAEQSRLTQLYFAANIGKRFHVLGWDHFQSSDRAALLPELQSYVEDFDSELRYGLGCTISGPVGTGKTLLLSAVLKDLVKRDRDVYFIQFRELVSVLTSGWRDPQAMREAATSMEARLKRCDLLGLDELVTGISHSHQVVVSQALEEVIRHRYNHSLPTMITTNLSMEEMAKEFPRVFSLLAPVNTWLYTKGNDFRSGTLREQIHTLRLNNERMPVI